jgi:iron-sulfur cluster assembly protein
MAGCSGFEYLLDYSEKALPEDEVFEAHGTQIHVNKKMLKRLLGSVIDYVEGLNPGFKITNPNVKASCGCGSSHGY